MKEQIPGTRAVGQRMANADLRFLETVQEKGFTAAEAERVFRYYVKHRIIKLDAVGGVWSVKHGVFWDTDVLKKAATTEVSN